MRFRIDLSASVPKDLEQPDLNEDAWSSDEHLKCIAVSDGASESYDSRKWARLLVDKYVGNQQFGPQWVADAAACYAASVDFEAMSWSKQAAFERGSFASLLGLQLPAQGTGVEVLAVGDSLACFIRSGRLVDSFPYSTAEQFDARPHLLSTLVSSNHFLDASDFFTQNTRSWSVEPGDVVLLVTDAVGQWLLREAATEPSAFDAQAMLSSDADLAALTLQLRAEKRIRYDDSTLLRVVIESD